MMSERFFVMMAFLSFCCEWTIGARSLHRLVMELTTFNARRRGDSSIWKRTGRRSALMRRPTVKFKLIMIAALALACSATAFAQRGGRGGGRGRGGPGVENGDGQRGQRGG